MADFKRRWDQWAAENLLPTLKDQGAESAKSAFDTFGTSILEAAGDNSAGPAADSDSAIVIESGPSADGPCTAPPRCVLSDCENELWAYGPNGEQLCQAHYEISQRSTLVTSALQRGDRLIKVTPASSMQVTEWQQATRTEPNLLALCECGEQRVRGTSYCERHLRGHLIFMLDQRRWPRLALPGGQTVGPGNDIWGSLLLGMGGAELRSLQDALEGTRL